MKVQWGKNVYHFIPLNCHLQSSLKKNLDLFSRISPMELAQYIQREKFIDYVWTWTGRMIQTHQVMYNCNRLKIYRIWLTVLLSEYRPIQYTRRMNYRMKVGLLLLRTRQDGRQKHQNIVILDVPFKAYRSKQYTLQQWGHKWHLFLSLVLNRKQKVGWEYMYSSCLSKCHH